MERIIEFRQQCIRNQYSRDHNDRFSLMLPKGGKAVLREYAKSRGESMNAVIISAIEAHTASKHENER